MRTLNHKELTQLVKKAQLGDKESLNRLAEEARVYLNEYVLRLTLQKDLTHDIVQESILEMFKVFNKLKNAERFLAWLDGIAFNKVRSHYGKKWRHKTVSLSSFNGDFAAQNSQNALADMINEEFKQIVVKSIRELAPRYRAILIMRCYKDMSFSEIAESLSCTKFGAQSLFYRAKRSLAKKLEGYGLGKGCLIAALVLFGKLTSSTQASAAQVSVTAATLKVGTAATIAGIAAGKSTIISLLAASVITGGTVAVTQGILKNNNENQLYLSDKTQQSWLYFPDGAGNSVMMRLLKYDDSGQNPYCQYLQNQHANYYYDDGTVTINNWRIYNPNLSVARLPNDDDDMTNFLSSIEGMQTDMEYVPDRRKGILLISGYMNDDKVRVIDRYSTLLEEEYFQFDWPNRTKVIDNRDPMHKRGWTYFTIEGDINGKSISGIGQLPLVYETSNKHSPWLKIQLPDGSRILDTKDSSCIVDKNGRAIDAYEPGTFFYGLSRPWIGLHSIDIVRRDAAKQHIEFETRSIRDTDDVEITLILGQTRLIYTIDMKNDLVKKINFSTANSDDNELRFTYLQDIDYSSDEFVEPQVQRFARSRQNSPGIMWLFDLINNN